MAVVEPNQTRVPDRLLIALLHAGVSADTMRQQYGASAEEIVALKARPVEPLQPDDMEHVPEDGYLYELWKGELIRMSPSKIRHAGDSGQLALELGFYLKQHPLGRLYVAEPGFRIGPD